MISHEQLSMAEIYSDCTQFFENDKHHFLSLLETNLNLDELIPHSFYSRYYASTGRPRDFHLTSMLWALLFQRIFSITEDTLLLTFLKFTKELRDFCGRMFYNYPEKDLRAYPGTLRGTEYWDETYKIRSVVEQSINHFKDNLCVANRKTQNAKTLHADLLLAGITQLLTVILVDKIHNHQFIRSLKPLIA